MQCGLPDGVLYDAVLVGLDKVGDVALIKLLPQKEGRDFPCAVMGDSDKVKAGDWSLAMGNPFLLATDFRPTVTFGMVSGVHRYQYPAGTLLEYTDCIQVDTSINPGNSGGPLFNLDGELIGINGRGSFEKRGRVNSGAGYAISINQIKNFLGGLRGGLDTDHATLGAVVKSDADEDEPSTRLLVVSILEDSDAHRRGLDVDDELVSFAGRPLTSTNQYKNVLGLFPKGWRVPLVYRRNNEKHEILVRLMQLQQTQLAEDAGNRPKVPPQPPGPPGRPRIPQPPRPRAPARNSPAAKFYEPKPGFANYYFNKLERGRLLAGFQKHGDFSPLSGQWSLTGRAEIKQRTVPLEVTFTEAPATSEPPPKPKPDPAADKKAPADAKKSPIVGSHATVHLKLGEVRFDLDPLKSEQDEQNLKEPTGSGGLLEALYQYRRLLTLGPAGFEQYCYYAGFEPFYLPASRGQRSFKDRQVDTEVLATEHAAVATKWYFSREDHRLLGFETFVSKDADPCEVYLSDYKTVDGRLLPHRLDVRSGNAAFATILVQNYNMSKGH
jgi:S1-C subfamily serine protease